MDVDSSYALRCMACQVVLGTAASRGEHYKSDWHRVNLKRSVSSLPPMPIEEFQARLEIMQKQQAEMERLEASRKAKSFACNACAKKFASQKAFDQHATSRRHLDKLQELITASEKVAAESKTSSAAGMRAPSEEETQVLKIEMQVALENAAHAEAEAEAAFQQRMEEATALLSTQCVFDSRELESTEKNLAYMAKHFGFFLPYVEYLTDIDGLLSYLGEKVGVGYACVCCDRSFMSVSAVQAHMVAKSHCRMSEDDELWMEEYAEWYDFGDEESESAGAGAWESVSGEDAEKYLREIERSGGAESNALMIVNDAPDHDTDAAGETAVELVMASGRAAGHRSLQRYYKQNVRPSRPAHEVARVQRVLAQYQALGWHSQPGNLPPLETRRKAAEIRKRQNVQLGVKTYYTRKAGLKPSMGVLNSGYRP